MNGNVYTIPQQPAASPYYSVTQVVTTGTAPVGNPAVACPTGTDCINYSIPVPASGPYIGAWSASGATLAEPAPLATYAVEGSTASTCSASGSVLNSNPPLALTGTGPFTSAAMTPNLQFTGCQ